MAPVDPAMEAMANKMAAGRQAAGRGAPVIQGPPQDVPENPSDDAAIIEEVKGLLTQAMERLSNIGGGGGGEVGA